MADNTQADPPEHEISVDMNAADPEKAVSRTRADLGRAARGDDEGEKPRTKAEKDLFKRMNRLEKNLTRNFDQRMAEKDAEHQRQLSELQAKLAKVSVERGGDDAADVAHEQAISALKDQLAAAYEKGDSAASAEITLKISKLDAQFWAKKAQAAGVVQREAPTVAATQQAAPKTNGPTAAGSRFINANEDWWDDPDYAIEQSAANTIYLNLVQKEGFDPKSDETFNEVAKQMKAKFPKLDIRKGRRGPDDDESDEDSAQEPHRNPRRSAAAARIDDRGQADARTRGTRRTLSKEDIATMRACRLDPDNDRDVVTFLREAVSLEQAS